MVAESYPTKESATRHSLGRAVAVYFSGYAQQKIIFYNCSIITLLPNLLVLNNFTEGLRLTILSEYLDKRE
jgi:hypothetical protein